MTTFNQKEEANVNPQTNTPAKPLLSDIEIAHEAAMQPIAAIGAKLGIPVDALLQYGPTKAKVSMAYIQSSTSRRGSTSDAAFSRS